MKRQQPDGVCACCGRVGPTWYDESLAPEEILCDRCAYAQRRWEDWQAYLACPGRGYPHFDPPPKTPPIRRDPPA